MSDSDSITDSDLSSDIDKEIKKDSDLPTKNELEMCFKSTIYSIVSDHQNNPALQCYSKHARWPIHPASMPILSNGIYYTNQDVEDGLKDAIKVELGRMRG